MEIRKTIVTDADSQPVAVQIDYEDWLKIEQALSLEPSIPKVTDLARYSGILNLTEYA